MGIEDINKKNVTEEEYRKYILSQIEKEKKYKISYDQMASSRGWKLILFIRKIIPPFIYKVKNIFKKTIFPNKIVYEKNKEFVGKTDIKTIAFYLPHINWNNVSKNKKLFKVHESPRYVHEDFGEYKFEDLDNLKKQIKLAKSHGIYGFAFYYYWFSGQTEYNSVLNLILDNKNIDFPFCICWNNNDLISKNKIVKQNYLDEDPSKFISDLKKYILDSRYIKIDDKPIIIVYNPKNIPNFNDLVKKWREEAKNQGIGEINIIARTSVFEADSNIYDNVDYEFDYSPIGYEKGKQKINNSKGKGKIIDYNSTVGLINYHNIYRNHFSLKPCYYTSVMCYDDSSKGNIGYKSFFNYSSRYFYNWNRLIIKEIRKRFTPDKRILFVNAWNNWMEGTYLEPDKENGYSNINALSKAIYDLPFDSNIKLINEDSEKLETLNKKIAIQFHVFYPDLLDEIIKNLNEIPYKFDLFISTNSENKKDEILKRIREIKNCEYFEVKIYGNIGRDILPLLLQMKDKISNYDYIGHFHTKKSLKTTFGNNWRKYLYASLLGTTGTIKSIFNIFETEEKCGVIFPETFGNGMIVEGITNNGKKLNSLLKEMNYNSFNEKKDKLMFPASSMFWARTDAIIDIFNLGLIEKDFPKEKGQLDGTIAHAIERCFGVLPAKKGYYPLKISVKRNGIMED